MCLDAAASSIMSQVNLTSKNSGLVIVKVEKQGEPVLKSQSVAQGREHNAACSFAKPIRIRSGCVCAHVWGCRFLRPSAAWLTCRRSLRDLPRPRRGAVPKAHQVCLASARSGGNHTGAPPAEPRTTGLTDGWMTSAFFTLFGSTFLGLHTAASDKRFAADDRRRFSDDMKKQVWKVPWL